MCKVLPFILKAAIPVGAAFTTHLHLDFPLQYFSDISLMLRTSHSYSTISLGQFCHNVLVIVLLPNRATPLMNNLKGSSLVFI